MSSFRCRLADAAALIEVMHLVPRLWVGSQQVLEPCVPELIERSDSSKNTPVAGILEEAHEPGRQSVAQIELEESQSRRPSRSAQYAEHEPGE